MIKRIIVILSLLCFFCLGGCGMQPPQEQTGDNNVQSFFSGKGLEVQEELPTLTPTLAPGQNQALPTTMIDGMYSTVKHSEKSRIEEIIEQDYNKTGMPTLTPTVTP